MSRAPHIAPHFVSRVLDQFHGQMMRATVFDIHSTGHGHAMSVSGYPILDGLEQMKRSINDC